MFQTEFRVRYYETDAMGIVHHSNYLRWFELARTEYLREIGTPYRALEESGLLAVVLEAHCKYLRPARYDDRVTVRVRLGAYTPVRIELVYEVLRDGESLCSGWTRHAFLRDGKPVAPARSAPELHMALEQALRSESEREEELHD
ncbi:MAG: acyl-CoA thioesterase [Clostridia bacterium]|nr:acyl-CoA thioesterase [Clostridia bacterium]